MTPARFISAVLLLLALAGALFHPRQALSEQIPTFQPPSPTKVIEAINTLSDSQSKQVLAEEAERLIQPVFIILPGILGSKLSIHAGGGDKVIWGNISPANLLLPPDESISYDGTAARAEPLDTFYVANKSVDIYGNAFEAIKIMNAGNASNVLRFSYDWRQSNVKSASDFADWLCRPDQRNKIEKHRIVFIAHSMGGLVLKYWLKHYYEAKQRNGADVPFSQWLNVYKIIFAGTPNFGAPKAILAFADKFTLYVDEQDNKFSRLLAAVDASTLAKSLNKYGIYFPSAYELLPIVRATTTCQEGFNWAEKEPFQLHLLHGVPVVQTDLFSVDLWRELKWPVQITGEVREKFLQHRLPELLGSAKRFLCDVGNYDVDSHFSVTRVASRNYDTVCVVNVYQPDSSEQPFKVESERCPGDGTVPFWIASDFIAPTPIGANTSTSSVCSMRSL